MVSETLSEEEQKALACVATGHHPETCDCNDEYAEPDRYCQYAHETFARIEQILAARTQALEAEVERLRTGVEALVKQHDDHHRGFYAFCDLCSTSVAYELLTALLDGVTP